MSRYNSYMWNVVMGFTLLVTMGCENQGEDGCSKGVLTGNLRVETPSDLPQYEGYTRVEGYASIICETCENAAELSCLEAVDGDVVIKETALSNLDDFERLETVGGLLSIFRNNDLLNMDGLSALTQANGGVEVVMNYSLANVDGLSSLDTTSEMYVSQNFNLTSIEGLSSLTSLNELEITETDALTTLRGLEGLTEVVDVTLADNDRLESIEGLENLEAIEGQLWISGCRNLGSLKELALVTQVGGSLTIMYTDVTTLEGLENIVSVGGEYLGISDNQLLENLEHLSSLTTVTGGLIIGTNDLLVSLNGLNNLSSAQYISIHNNPNLTDLDGLSGLQTIGGGVASDGSGEIDIRNNGLLSSLDGLKNLTSFNGTLNIIDNPLLSDEEIVSFLDFLAGIGWEGEADISGNGGGI